MHTNIHTSIHKLTFFALKKLPDSHARYAMRDMASTQRVAEIDAVRVNRINVAHKKAKAMALLRNRNKNTKCTP
jgi:hypothetical protein